MTSSVAVHNDKLVEGARCLHTQRVSHRDGCSTVSSNASDLPSEDALNAVYRTNFTAMCGVNIMHVVDTTRKILQLPEDATPTTLRILNHGAFNKIFLLQFGSTSIVARVPFRKAFLINDPIRLASQVAAYQFLSIDRPQLSIPRLLYAELNSASPSNAPFTLYELCNGTPLTWQEWTRPLTDAQKATIIDLLAENWAHITEPVSFKTIGRILADASEQSPSTTSWSTLPQHRPNFRIVSMIPPQSAEHAASLQGSLLPGHQTIVEFWHQHIEDTHRTLLALKIPDDLPDKESLDETLRCVEILREIADLAGSLDPQTTSCTRSAVPSLALIHPDYAATRNILFSSDRTRIEGIIDWDDSVVVPRDIAATYPQELMTRTWWEVDPELSDSLEVPPETEPEDVGLAQLAIEETHLRRRFRETIQRFDPEFAMFYTDPRARFRRRVHFLASGGWETWRCFLEYILKIAREDARVLVHEKRLLTIQEIWSILDQ